MNVHELTLQNYAAGGGCPSACQPILYLGTAGSYGNEQINVVLGEGWQGLTVKAVFQPCGVAVVVPDGGGVISVPWEATQSVIAYPKGRIVFEGVTDGRVLISTDIPYAVGSHSDTEGSNSQPPTPSEWEQFVNEVKGDADRAEKAADKAESASVHAPQVNPDTGYWQVWDAVSGQYVDTDTKAEGPQGPQGPKGDTGLGVPSPTQSDAGKVPTVKADGSAYELAGPYAPLSAAIRPTASGNPVSITDSVEWPLLGLKIYGKSTQASNQLLPLTEDTYTTGGLTATLQGDGSLVVNGTPQSVPTNLVFFYLNLEPGTYYVSGGVKTSGNLYLCVQIASPSGGEFYVNQSFTITGNETSVTAMIQNVDTTSLNDYAISPMINRGNSALPIQKYAMPTPESPIPITSAGDGGSIPVTFSDGGSQSQTLILSTPNGLPGIPVTSGGNYTIDGQQYRGNIRDYGAEVDTIAVEQIDSYNGEDVGDVWMSSTGQLTTGAQVVYALDEPTTQAIPATEMASYRALQTYDGATVVSTAEDVAGLEVRYVADAQKYIDDRLAAAESHIQEIAAAQLNAQTGG